MIVLFKTDGKIVKYGIANYKAFTGRDFSTISPSTSQVSTFFEKDGLYNLIIDKFETDRLDLESIETLAAKEGHYVYREFDYGLGTNSPIMSKLPLVKNDNNLKKQ